MAKKVLTPEEVKAKMEKKSAKRQLFFGTFTKALAFFLAIAMAYSLATIAFTPVTAPTGTVQNGGQQSSGESVDNGDENLLGGGDLTDSTPSGSGDSSTPSGSGDSSTPSGSGNSSTPSGDANKPSGDSSKPASGPSKAEVIKFFNDETAKASKGSYTLHREGTIVKDIDVGSLTSILDGIIKGVDENASLNSVVGGFLGLNKPIDGVVTNGAGEGFDGKYMMKAMTLTEADIAGYKVDGNKYMIQVNKCVTPDENSAMAHATNDYITFQEVNTSIASAVGDKVKVEESGSSVTYTSILFTATVADGKITKLEYSYGFSANLTIKVGISAKGTGAAKITGVYSDIKY